MESPYVPGDLNLPDFFGNFVSDSNLFLVSLPSSFLVVSLVWILSGKLAKVDRLLLCWWLLSGLIHIILDGYYVFSPEFYKEETTFYLAEIWKEYSKGDSRYAARDSAVVSIEVFFAVLVGPACLLAIYAVAAEKSYSYTLQFAVALGQLYGIVVYFLGPYLDGVNYASSPIYYYAYYIGINISWIFVPLLICMPCWKRICAADELQDQKKARSH